MKFKEFITWAYEEDLKGNISEDTELLFFADPGTQKPLNFCRPSEILYRPYEDLPRWCAALCRALLPSAAV